MSEEKKKPVVKSLEEKKRLLDIKIRNANAASEIERKKVREEKRIDEEKRARLKTLSDRLVPRMMNGERDTEAIIDQEKTKTPFDGESKKRGLFKNDPKKSYEDKYQKGLWLKRRETVIKKMLKYSTEQLQHMMKECERRKKSETF